MPRRGLALAAICLVSACTVVACTAAPSGGKTASGTPTGLPGAEGSPGSSLGSTAAQPASTATPVPSPTPVPSATPEILPLASGVPAGVSCPASVASPMRLRDFVAIDPSCFGHLEISVIGWEGDPQPIGFEPPTVEPGWLIYPSAATSSALWDSFSSGGQCLAAGPECPWLFVHVAPGSSLTFNQRNRWVVVTGHVNDPAAATCHYVYPPGTTQREKLPDSDARHWCTEQLVISTVRETSSPPLAP